MFHPLSVWNRRRRALTPTQYSNGEPFYALQQEMNRLFDDAFAGFGSRMPDMYGADARISVDMRETGNAVIVEAELPGVAEEDIDVELNDTTLTIRGEKRSERQEDENGDYHVVERSYGSFARSLSLPFAVDPDSVEAVFRDGVLKLTLPKPPESRSRAKKIGIRRG